MDVAVALLAALGVLIVPGLPTVLALRLRALPAAAVITPLSLAMITVAAEISSSQQLPWSPLHPVLLGLVVGAVLAIPSIAVRALSRHRSRTATHRRRPSAPVASGGLHGDPEPVRRRELPVGLGVAVGAVLITVQQLQMMGSIRAVSQTYDAVFHLNAVRHVLRAQDASAYVVGGMTQLPGHETFYPAAWHQTVSLVVLLSDASIPLASNLVMLVVAALVWPLGLAALVATATHAGPVGRFLAGALAGVSAAFPLALMSWGILWPYALAFAMMPTALLLLAQLLRVGPAGPQRMPIAQVIALIPLVGLAIIAAHPQVYFAAALIGLPMMVWATLLAVRGLVLHRRFALVSLLSLLVATPAIAYVSWQLWIRYRPSMDSMVWSGNASPKEAIGQAMSLSMTDQATFLPLALLVVACLLALLFLGRDRWLVLTFVVVAAHGALARHLPISDLRYLLTGGWYGDTFRITAFSAVVGVPLLALGLDIMVQRLAARGGRLQILERAWLPAVVAALVLVTVMPSASMRQAQDRLHSFWRSDDLLSADELQLLEELPRYVPEDAVIATNAWNGSSLAYAISDRTVLNTFMGFRAAPAVHLLNAKLDEANTDPAVCDAAADLKVEYALDFGERELFDRRSTYTGLNEIAQTGAAEEVARVGEASLWRILPCEGARGPRTP